jgi:4-amino-4-deoxychorismate lyase
MCLLFETIKVQNKTLYNLEYHNERLNKSRRDLFGCTDFLDLKIIITIPENFDNNIYKCRVIYSSEVEKIEFLSYTPRKIRTLKLVECNAIEYSYKYLDRKIFDQLLQNTDADDVLIIKNGIITDTSFSNIVFFDDTKWITPARPLLRGTKREKLLKEKQIIEDNITKDNLKYFKKAALINAMIDLEESPTININDILL